MSNTQLVKPNVAHMISSEIIEKVLLHNDLSPLSPQQKVMYVRHLATSYGLDPDTNPIKIMKFQGKEVPYADKGAAEQLRKSNKVSIDKMDKEILDGGIYIVTAYASEPSGRKDSSTGVVSINGLKSDALCNAMLKAETKAKRRVTLSICGLGMIDECEVDSIKGAIKVDVVNEPIKEIETEVVFNSSVDLQNDLQKIKDCMTHQELKQVFTDVSKYWQKRKDMDAIKTIILAKDERKGEIDVIEYNQEIESAEKNHE